MSAGAWAAVGGLAAFALAVELLRFSAARVTGTLQSIEARLLAAARETLLPIRRADRTGDGASGVERRRLSFGGALLGAMGGAMIAGVAGAICLAVILATLGWRISASRVSRYRRSLDESAASAARALASALSAGHTVRASFRVAAAELRGPMLQEFRSMAARLELGEPTTRTLTTFCSRAGSRRIDLIAAAVAMHQRSGGDLAGVLRSVAATIEASEQLRDELTAASSQARFTSSIVAAMPIGAMVLGELAAPGLAGRVLGSPIGVGLLAAAAVLQVSGLAAVRRIARIEP